jgi:hypothetical protein
MPILKCQLQYVNCVNADLKIVDFISANFKNAGFKKVGFKKSTWKMSKNRQWQLTYKHYFLTFSSIKYVLKVPTLFTPSW